MQKDAKWKNHFGGYTKDVGEWMVKHNKTTWYNFIFPNPQSAFQVAKREGGEGSPGSPPVLKPLPMTQGTWQPNNPRKFSKFDRLFRPSHSIPKLANLDFPPVSSGLADLEIWSSFMINRWHVLLWRPRIHLLNLSPFSYVATQEPCPGWAIDHLCLLASPSAMELHSKSMHRCWCSARARDTMGHWS